MGTILGKGFPQAQVHTEFIARVLEVIPPTSLVVPLLGKYLIFAMILVSLR